MHTFLKFAVAALLFVLLCGCGGDDGLTTAPPLQPAPEPRPVATTGFIWGHVFGEDDSTGVCLIDAVVEIVDGPGAGQKVVQKEPCSAWGYGDGFYFNDLPLGVTIRLRATKEGYQPKEFETMAVTGGTALVIVLKKE